MNMLNLIFLSNTFKQVSETYKVVWKMENENMFTSSIFL